MDKDLASELTDGKNIARVFYGPDAYAYLLEIIVGAVSGRQGESNIAGQFFAAWDMFVMQKKEEAPRFRWLIDSLRADHKLIRANVTADMKPQRHELAAKNLSDPGPGGCMLLIGNVNDHGALSGFTDSIARVMGNNRKGRISTLFVTHPDPTKSRTLYKGMEDLKKRGILQCDIERIPFNILSTAVEMSDTLYIDIPMGANREVENEIIMVWKGRARRDNRLVHLRGDPDQQGRSSALWSSAELDNYISPEDIRVEMARIGRLNHRLKHEAEVAAKFCGFMRAQGINTISTRNFNEFLQDHRTSCASLNPLPADPPALSAR